MRQGQFIGANRVMSSHDPAKPISAKPAGLIGKLLDHGHPVGDDFLPPHRGPGPAMDLKPATKRLTKLLALTFAALFWNTIVAIFLFDLIPDILNSGDSVFPWFMTLFMIPFVLVGLFLIGAAFHTLLTLANPAVTLTVTTDAVPLGSILDVAWGFTGPVHRIRRLRIYLEAQESATYQRGTSTTTDTHPFLRLMILDTTDPLLIAAGGIHSIQIPSDTMHSFKASSNAIQWNLHVRGSIHLWPDVHDSFPFVITPAIHPPVPSLI
jgi:hypothetical protein